MPTYRFALGYTNTLDTAPIGYTVEVEAATQRDAIAQLRSCIPEFEIVQPLEPWPDSGVGEIRVYFNPTAISADAIEEVK